VALALHFAKQSQPSRPSGITVDGDPRRDFKPARQTGRHRLVHQQRLKKLFVLVEQKADRPVAQNIVPERDGGALDVFAQAVEPQQFRDGIRVKVVGLESHAAGPGQNLAAHGSQRPEPRQPAVILRATAAVAPPQPGEVHFGGNARKRVRIPGAQFHHPRQVEQIPRHPARRVVTAQNDRQRMIAFGKNDSLVVADLLDRQHRQVGAPQIRRKLQLPFVVSDPAGDDNAPAGISGSRHEQVRDGRPFAIVIDLVDVIDEQRGPAAAAQFIEKLVQSDWTFNDLPESQPSARNDTSVAKDENAALRLQLPRKAHHDR
jgi:hypothetical protein